MTGILPIQSDGSQSAISEFWEYTILSPGPFLPYTGFTEAEVKKVCQDYDRDFSLMKQWYDGYSFSTPEPTDLYNPHAVMRAAISGSFQSYWRMSSSSKALLTILGYHFEGLPKAIAELVGGIRVATDPRTFRNDPKALASKDDVLTLLIHYGYLSYDEEAGTVRIPNDEIRQEFATAVRMLDHGETLSRVRAAQIQKIHNEECSPLFYNNEQSLRSVIKLAYFSYRDTFFQFEELPGGKGYADLIYYPKKNLELPTVVIELKWDQPAGSAIGQILDRDYPAPLRDPGRDLLLVGITYDKANKSHTCQIVEHRYA